MSAITSDWALIETEAPVTPAVESGKVCRREEFRSALDNYIAGYVADQQKRRPIATGYVGSYVSPAVRSPSMYTARSFA